MKFSRKQVSELRKRHIKNPKLTTTDLIIWVYSYFSIEISRTSLLAILSNKTWIDKNYVPPKKMLSSTYPCSLNEESVDVLRNYFLQGNSYKQTHLFSETVGVRITLYHLSCILRNLYWKDEIYQNRLDHKNGKVSGIGLVIKA